VLYEAGLATLLFDLLRDEEEGTAATCSTSNCWRDACRKRRTGSKNRPETLGLNLGYFGASTGAAAALVAAARKPERVKAVVSRGGRPDMAQDDLPQVTAPTLLIVGGYDDPVIGMNEDALKLLQCEKKMEIIPEASHLFPEPGALEQVALLARDWFLKHLPNSSQKGKAQASQDPPTNEPDPMFHNREDAARQLAEKLKELDLHDPLVLGIPRGGVVTGAVLARELGAELDVTLSRKLRAPYQPELAVGAVGEDGYVYLDEHTKDVPGISAGYVERERQHQLQEIAYWGQFFC
jgi:putative phosphoribosyl transferase